jgi:hypothetical protein
LWWWAAGFPSLLSAGKKNPSTLFILFFEKYKIRGRHPGAICRRQGISYGGFIQIYKNCYLFLVKRGKKLELNSKKFLAQVFIT